MDLFDKLKVENSVIGQYAADSEGYYIFPKLACFVQCMTHF